MLQRPITIYLFFSRSHFFKYFNKVKFIAFVLGCFVGYQTWNFTFFNRYVFPFFLILLGCLAGWLCFFFLRFPGDFNPVSMWTFGPFDKSQREFIRKVWDCLPGLRRRDFDEEFWSWGSWFCGLEFFRTECLFLEFF